MRFLQRQVKVKHSRGDHLEIFTLRIENLYREIESILCPHITHDHIDIFWFSGAEIFLWFDFRLPSHRLIIVGPDLPACH